MDIGKPVGLPQSLSKSAHSPINRKVILRLEHYVLLWDHLIKCVSIEPSKYNYWKKLETVARHLKGWYTIGDVLGGREARASHFVCTHKTHVAGTEYASCSVRSGLKHKTDVLVWDCLQEIRCLGYLSLLHDARIQTTWISYNMLRGQNVFFAIELFRKLGNGCVARMEKCCCIVSLQHVP